MRQSSAELYIMDVLNKLWLSWLVLMALRSSFLFHNLNL